MSGARDIKIGLGPSGSVAISADRETLWLNSDEAQLALTALSLALSHMSASQPHIGERPAGEQFRRRWTPEAP